MCVRIHEAWEGQLVVQMHSLRRQLSDKKALPVEVFEQAGTCSPTTRVLVGVDDGVDVVGVRPSAAKLASGWPPVQGRHRGRRWAPGRSPVWPPRRPRILDVER
jgi:hypothetical protein